MNFEAARGLLKRYEELTLEDIEQVWAKAGGSGYKAANLLTGFGNCGTCPLCKGIIRCSDCIWYVSLRDNEDNNLIYMDPCLSGNHSVSYYAIYDASTPNDLLRAIRARAEILKQAITLAQEKEDGK